MTASHKPWVAEKISTISTFSRWVHKISDSVSSLTWNMATVSISELYHRRTAKFVLFGNTMMSQCVTRWPLPFEYETSSFFIYYCEMSLELTKMYFVNPNNQRPLTNKFKQHMLSWRIRISVLLVAMSIFSNRCGSTVTSTGHMCQT